MYDVSDELFDKLISRAMDELPQEYIKGLDNVAIVYDEWPDQFQATKAGLREGLLLLGLYEGIPLPERTAGYNMVLPDKITLFKRSLCMISRNETDFFEHIKRTLWHEIAHFYGLNHEKIDALQHHSH